MFPECNPSAITTTSHIYAANGGKVADVKTQIDTFIAAGPVTSDTLVTILAGQNDILEQYALVKAGTVTEAQAQATIEQAPENLRRELTETTHDEARSCVR